MIRRPVLGLGRGVSRVRGGMSEIDVFDVEDSFDDVEQCFNRY